MGYLKTLVLASCLAALPTTGAGAVMFTGSTGSSQSFTNMQPSLSLTQYIQNGDEAYFPDRNGKAVTDPAFVARSAHSAIDLPTSSRTPRRAGHWRSGTTRRLSPCWAAPMAATSCQPLTCRT